jgi:hypothetical protein
MNGRKLGVERDSEARITVRIQATLPERLLKWPRLVGSGVEILRAMSANAADTRMRFGRDG